MHILAFCPSMNVALPIRFQHWIYPFINGILPDCLNCCSHPGLIPAPLQSGTQASLSLLCPALTDSLVPGWPLLRAGSDFSFLPSLLQVLPGCNCGNKYVIMPECLCGWDILKRWDGDYMYTLNHPRSFTFSWVTFKHNILLKTNSLRSTCTKSCGQ